MEVLQTTLLTLINEARAEADAKREADGSSSVPLHPLVLDPAYSDAATRECERMLARVLTRTHVTADIPVDAVDGLDSIPLPALSSDVDVYHSLGLYDCTAWLVCACTRDGLLPPGMDALSGVEATEELDAKLTSAAAALHAKMCETVEGRGVLLDARVTHVGIGSSANSDGQIRIVEAFVTRAADVDGVTHARMESGCVVLETSDMAAGVGEGGETGPGVLLVHARIAPSTAVYAPHDTTPTLLGAYLQLERSPQGYADPALHPVCTPIEGVDHEDSRADLSHICGAVRVVSWPPGLHGENVASALSFPWTFHRVGDGSVSIPVSIAAAHAEACAAGTAIPHKTATGVNEYRYVLTLAYACVPPGEEVPYTHPRAGYDTHILVGSTSTPGAGSETMSATRVSVVVRDDAAAVALAASAPHIGARTHTAGEAEEGGEARFGRFSECAIVSMHDAARAGFRSQALTAAPAEEAEDVPGEIALLPVSLCVADAPSLAHITRVMLVEGADDTAAAAACPPGFDIIPVNVAEMVNAALGGVSGEGGGDTTRESADDEEPPRARVGIWPRVVYVCVCRRDDAEAAAETAGDGASLTPALVDMALFVAYGRETSEARLKFPSFPPQMGYSSVQMDMTVVAPAGEGATGEESDTPALHRIPVRVCVYSTSDEGAAQAFLASGGCITVTPGTHEAMGEHMAADGVVGTMDVTAAAPFERGHTSASTATRSNIHSRVSTGADMLASEAYTHAREQLLELLAATVADSEALTAANSTLQRQLAIYFSIRTSEDERDKGSGAAGAAAGARGSAAAAAAAFAAADKDKRFREQIESIAAERVRMVDASVRADAEARMLQTRAEEKQLRADSIARAFSEFKRETARTSLYNNTGKPMSMTEYARVEQAERAKDADVARVQLRHIHLAAQVAKLEDQLKRREQVAEGLAMIDFEQLKIENSTLNEKIEDRNEELGKLRKKATVAVQVLTHVREKLHYVESENARLSAELAAIEAEVTDQRTSLALGKKDRERMRVDNEHAKDAQGFAHADALAIDFERRKRDVLHLKQRILTAQETYASLARRMADVSAQLHAQLTAMSAGPASSSAAMMMEAE